ncbi:MAG TPA: HAD family hydrolase [Myxococcales bacterium]|nr:HAD family hydrolase [Myxococcales bacterium]
MSLPDGRARAAIFDLDGTLLDTLEDIAAAMDHALQQHGLAPHTLDEYRQFIGQGVRNLTRLAVGASGGAGELEAEVYAAYRRRYEERMVVATRPYPGVVELLQALKAEGIPAAVLSNKPDDATSALVERFFPGLFTVARGERPTAPRKPDPASALEVARGLDAAPGDCLFAGDSKVDMETATRAEMFAVGVLWGYRSRDELEANGARALVDSPAEILRLCQGGTHG